MHCGNEQSQGGRIGEATATGVSAALLSLGFELGRLKTGTPPRVHRDTIDYGRCETQPGDDVPTPFSAMTDAILQRQVDCWVTWTHPGVHDHIRANLHRAPMYSGQIQSRGPRYCPSIEDKVVRFADKDAHQIFLEPEGYDNERVYCNGISTSLPKDVQEAFVREVPGLEQARILQHGYAVEYDFVPTHQTKLSLETKLVDGLFIAGQINGTSGYEEAAAQGLIAGINAVRYLRREEPFTLARDEAYIGVMIDDLITRPPLEPYRMFTSRAEYRLLLRADNADQRLTPIGRKLGLVDDARWARYEARREAVAAIRSLATHSGSLAAWMRRPDVTLATFADRLAGLTDRTFSAQDVEQVLTEAKYSGYVDRQAKQIERFRRLESMAIPARTDYATMPELRFEARERLSRVAPATLGQAARVSGVTPADITVLWIYLTGRRAG
jgi:tRNA uridine 5-carboxymethylaminomethyl modification enzyme